MEEHRNVITSLLAGGASYRGVAEAIKAGHAETIQWCKREGLRPLHAEIAGDTEAGGIPFADVESGMCRRPLWSSRETVGNVCGRPTGVKRPYCPDCEEIMYWRGPEAESAKRSVQAARG